jgi:tetratricopeptide (TPR) repeat protein
MNYGDYAQSETYFNEALETLHALPFQDPFEARVLSNLGTLYYAMKDLGKTEKAFKKAISITEKVLGPDSVELAPFLSNLSGLYLTRRKLDPVRPLLDRALSLLRQSGESDRLTLAAVLDNLGMMHYFRKNFVESETPLRRAYDIRLSMLGPEHPKALETQVKLAAALGALGRYEDAERLYGDALALYEKTSRLRTSEAATALEGLASLLRHTSRARSAEPLEEKAERIRFDLQNTVPARSLR